MSLNTITARQPDLQPGENTLSTNTCDVELRIPATLTGPKRTEYSKGRIWVTNQRVIFLGDAPSISSLVIPYPVLLSCKFNLPLLGANHIMVSFLPDPLAEPTLPSPGRGSSLEVKLIIGEGATHGTFKIMEGERARWEESRRRGEEEDLPVYQA